MKMKENLRLNVVQGDTCFSAQKRNGVACQRRSCVNWFDSKKDVNCSVVGAQNSPWTLQEIGESYGLTRMRICQIEKKVVSKIRAACL